MKPLKIVSFWQKEKDSNIHFHVEGETFLCGLKWGLNQYHKIVGPMTGRGDPCDRCSKAFMRMIIAGEVEVAVK